MANLITNKHKQISPDKPSGFEKRLATRRLRRRADLEIQLARPSRNTGVSKHTARKRSGSCPICLGRLAKNAKRTRYVRECAHCQAHWAPDRRCGRCGTFRVWTNRLESRCKGCGHEVT